MTDDTVHLGFAEESLDDAIDNLGDVDTKTVADYIAVMLCISARLLVRASQEDSTDRD